MKKIDEDIEIISPKTQLSLFGYKSYFNYFIKLYDNNEMPNSVLLSGLKGSGKSTFVYHFINYLLSKDEENEYSVNDFVINKDNLSYKLLNTNTHPNFFLIENKLFEKNIKIDQVRDLLKFLNKSTFSRDLKIIMIDNAESLNLNSSNSLLKVIEEPKNNTFIFIIHNSASKILDTIKSRCVEFRFFFTTSEKKNIFKNIIKQYKSEGDKREILENLYFDTPGNLIKYFLILNKANIDLTGNKFACILYFVEKYKNKKNPETLSFLSLFIEIFYNELCLNNNRKLSSFFFNQSKILKQIDDMKRLNLDENNILFLIKDILLNEAK